MAFQQALHRPGRSEAASHQPVIRAVPNSVRNSREATTIQRFKKYRTAEETALYAGEPSTPRARAGIMRALAGSYQLSFAGSTQYATRFSVLVSTMEERHGARLPLARSAALQPDGHRLADRPAPPRARCSGRRLG